MRNSTIYTATVLCLALASGAANAKGCLGGAAVGGVAGHVAGKHGVLGAAAGCVVGRHEANKKDKEQAARAAQDAENNSAARQAAAPGDTKR